MNKKQRITAAAIIICIFLVFQYFQLKPYYIEQNFSDVGRASLEEMDYANSLNLSTSDTFHYNDLGKKELKKLIKQITVLKVEENKIPELDFQQSITFYHPIYFSKNFWFHAGQDPKTGKEYLVYFERNGEESYYHVKNKNGQILDAIKKISQNEEFINNEL